MKWFLFLLTIGAVFSAFAQEKDIDAAQSDESHSTNQDVKWNEFDLGPITMRLGGGVGVDSARYFQDDTSKKQMALDNVTALRDLRVLLKGRFNFAPRWSYTLGYMYDGAQDDWRFRQTGLMMDVPEWNGNLFIGRTKEGFSSNKAMVGYYIWTQERSAANEAFLPILADGVKWTGRLSENKVIYNLGLYKETLTAYESYDKNNEIGVARGVWLPMYSEEDKRVLHLAVEGRYGTAKNGTLQFRSKPESFPAQDYAVDTGKFKAHSNTIGGVEAYWSPGPLMFGMEYYWNKVNSPSTGNPLFHGGEIFTAYLLTGEIRKYNKKGGYFEAVSPARSVFSGGPGAWEFVLRASYADLDDRKIDGGRFSKITPMMNWYLSDNLRLEFVYGYGELDKNGSHGTLQMVSSRIQLIL
ncbi:MAG: OprO/OprP family phosphate-selective porin [Bacteriovoracaceae bacterium]